MSTRKGPSALEQWMLAMVIKYCDEEPQSAEMLAKLTNHSEPHTRKLLKRLAEQRLASHGGRNQWRPTLAGLNYADQHPYPRRQAAAS
ncbi:hypothetical protein [Nocardia thailandica]|uniref:hypothetical protein n=1 Tax=Nocardia thailandica TaxID=257275 RepID=UPI0005BDB4F4|nr:hypothetical protein [Nocardia thailandica]